MTDTKQTLDLFVYGSLRTGQMFHERWLADRIFRKSPATVQGQLWSYMDDAFPVLYIPVFPKDASTVHGEFITVWLDEKIPELVQWETDAGFNIRWLEATFDNGTTQPALTFVWPRLTDKEIGDRIAIGDWCAYMEQQAQNGDPLKQAIILGELVDSNPQLYKDIVEIMVKEMDDRFYTIEQAQIDLETLLFNSDKVSILYNYIIQTKKDK